MVQNGSGSAKTLEILGQLFGASFAILGTWVKALRASFAPFERSGGKHMCWACCLLVADSNMSAKNAAARITKQEILKLFYGILSFLRRKTPKHATLNLEPLTPSIPKPLKPFVFHAQGQVPSATMVTSKSVPYWPKKIAVNGLWFRA